jgi:glycosyltransferase involved in cell wall biosynthesis
MKILASAFACSPRWGSEPGLGWGWVYTLAEKHDVTVLTHGYFRSHIEADLPSLPKRRIRFEYLDLKPLRGEFKDQMLNSQIYYLRWQKASRARVQALLEAEHFDLLHHVTWGNFRWPIPFFGLSVPLLVGPMGGGECAPPSMYRSLPVRVQIKEAIRAFIIWTGRYDPWVRRGLRDARWIFCRTPHTTAALPAFAQARAVIAHDIGSPEVLLAPVVDALAKVPNQLRCLFVGRLLGWKGPQFVLRAVAELKQRGIAVQLTMVGNGELEAYLHALAQELNLTVEWKQGLSRTQVLDLYPAHDVFVFPSLHDSGGSVVLESLSRGCPVVCLDLGGPPHFIDAQSGRTVVGSDGNEAAVPGRLADALEPLARDPELRIRLRHGALRRAHEHVWSKRVADAYAQIETAIGHVPSPIS